MIRAYLAALITRAARIPGEGTMSTYPAAVKRLIPPGSNDPRITPTQVILHVAVFEGDSLYDFFKDRSGGIESHFYIRRTGEVEQYRDTHAEADANYTANSRAISVETQGMGDGEWTAEQVEAIKRLLLWAHETHGIPLRKCPAHDQPGIGYHTLWGAPSPWTPVAKSCPGPDRVRQFDRELVPWLTQPAAKTTTTTEGDDMSWLDEPMNVNAKGGNRVLANVTWAEGLKYLILKEIQGEKAAQEYLERAQESKVGGE